MGIESIDKISLIVYGYKSGIMEKCTRISYNSDQSLVYNLATIVGLTDKLKRQLLQLLPLNNQREPLY